MIRIKKKEQVDLRTNLVLRFTSHPRTIFAHSFTDDFRFPHVRTKYAKRFFFSTRAMCIDLGGQRSATKSKMSIRRDTIITRLNVSWGLVCD